MAGIFYNKGEVCAAGSRVLVERKVHDELVEKMKGRAAKLTQGDTLDPKTRLGPQASESAARQGALLHREGKGRGREAGASAASATPRPGPGYFVQPTIFADAKNEMTIAQEEIFGPVATVIPFDDVDQAIARRQRHPLRPRRRRLDAAT